MASKNFPIGKIAALVVLVIAIRNWGIPWYKDHFGGGSRSTSPSSSSDGASGSGGASCASSAERASLAWGAGIGRFVNPPYDQGAWSSFKSEIDGRLSEARSACSCSAESCAKAKEAVDMLDGLVTQLDSAIRSGTPFSNEVVRQQEKLDGLIDEAKSLVRAGK